MFRICRMPRCSPTGRPVTFRRRGFSGHSISAQPPTDTSAPRFREQRITFRQKPHERPAPRDKPLPAVQAPRVKPAEQLEMAALIDARDWKAALALGEKIASTSRSGQAQTFRILIEGLITGGEVDQAVPLINTFIRANPDKFAATSVMRALVRVGKINEALALFKRMPRIDSIAGSVLLLGLIQAERLDDASAMLLDMERLRPPPSPSMYRTLLSLFLSKKEPEKAAVFVRKSSQRDAIARNADILARLGLTEATQSAMSVLATKAEKTNAAAVSPGRRIVGALLQLAKFGKVEEIERSIAEMRDGDSAALADARSVLLHTYVKLRQLRKAEALLTSIQDGPLTPWLLQASLKAYVALGDVRAAAELLETSSRQGLTATESAYNTVLSGWIKLRQMSEAEALIEAMAQRELAPTIATYALLLRGYSEAGNLAAAEKLVAGMRSAGVQPTSIIWGALLALVARKDPAGAQKQLAALEAEGLTPSAELYNAIIAELARKGRLTPATALKDRLLSGPNKPNEITYNTIVSAQLKRKNIDVAEALCTEMRGLGLKPDLLMCKEMERTWRASGNEAKAAEWATAARSYGVEVAKQEKDPVSPAVLSLRRALSAIGDGKLAEMRTHVTALRTANTRVDDYVVIAKRLAHRGAFDEIRWLLTEASAAGLGRPVGIWNVILAELVRLRKESEATALLKEMANEGTQPDADTFGLQVALLAQSNRLSEAEAVFNSMKDRGVQPTTFACNRLLHAYARNADLKRANWLLERMRELGVPFSPFTYAELVRLHVTRGDINAALKVTEEHGDGLPPSAFLPVIRDLEQSEASAELIAKLKHQMEKARRQISAPDTPYVQLRHLLE